MRHQLVPLLLVLALAVPAAAEELPRWPRLVCSTPPDGWRQPAVEGDGRTTWRGRGKLEVEDATLTDAEVAERVVKGATGPARGARPGEPAVARTLLRVVAGAGGEGGALAVAVPAVPTDGPLARALATGATVEVTLVEAPGWKLAARAVVLRDAAGKLLLLFDDGGYGAALRGAAEQDDIELASAAIERTQGGGWQRVPVGFRRGNDAASPGEGQAEALGRSGLAVKLLVSRAGPQVTDADLTPRAWLAWRVR